jgi:hypothetical protein
MMAILHKSQSEDALNITDTLSLELESSDIQSDWIRWVQASINKHFEDRKFEYELYLEGDERTLQDEIEFAELRVDGPFILNPQKNLFFLDYEINVLLQAHQVAGQLYNIQKLIGVFAKAFTNIIKVYKFGTGPIDDDSLLGCLQLQRSLRERVNINYYGIIRPDTRLTQATIEGHYRLEQWREGD